MSQHPYRESAAPEGKRRPGSPIPGTLVGLVVLHVVFALAFLLLTPVLRWIGPNNGFGLFVRVVTTLLSLGVVGLVLLVLLSGWRGRRGMVAGGVLFVGWLAMFIWLAGHEPKPFLLLLRAGAVDLEALGAWEMMLSGLANLAVSGMLAVILIMKPLHADAELQKSRLIVANLEPCPRCKGSWQLDGELKRCQGCGNEDKAPTLAEIKAIRGTPDA